ncbi:SGNH/GDSL hydrolase family protein [Ectopseudomonas mendocina]|uniref:SGNH/GDSL hydrolase family protein n=1 Tax=Ectopseudomonas mendocina TaxID=300 RepID=A0ABZ2RJ83_ECTME
MRAYAWWVKLLVLAPLALPLAVYTRRTALRLPPAEGPQAGVAGVDKGGVPLRLLVLGESTVAGVGVTDSGAALAAQLAQALVERTQRPVQWRACGENGVTVAQARLRLLPDVLDQSFDLALLVFGVNDTTHLTSLKRWASEQAAMVESIQARGIRVAASGVPPLQHFRALPGLLRYLLGERGALLDVALKQRSVAIGVQHVPIELEFSAAYLAEDGYHPSALGYRVWAQRLAERLLL